MTKQSSEGLAYFDKIAEKAMRIFRDYIVVIESSWYLRVLAEKRDLAEEVIVACTPINLGKYQA